MDVVLSKFVERVKDLIEEREANGKTVAEIAVEAKQNISDLYHWKSQNNLYLPSLISAVRLADYFECTLAYLFGDETEYSPFAPSKDLPNFSKRLKEVIAEQKMPIMRLAKEAGFANTSVIYGWLNGKSVPRVESLFALARVFGRTPDYIIGRE